MHGIIEPVSTHFIANLASLAVVWKPFSPQFIKRTKSHYRDEWSFTTVDQLNALCKIGDNELEHQYDQPGTMGLAPENPLHFDDVFIAGLEIMIGEGYCV